MISIGLSHPGDSWISRGIDKETGGLGWCHAFLVFHDYNNYVFEAHSDFGVRFKDRVIENNEKIFPITCLTKEDEVKVLMRAMLMAGDKYDFCGVTSFEIGFIVQNDHEEFCSEAVVICLQSCGLFSGLIASDISPNKLSQLIQTLPS